MSRHKLRNMNICYSDVDLGASDADTSGHARLQDFLDLCSAYPTNLSLSLHLPYGTYCRSLKPTDTVAPGVHTVHPLRYSLSSFEVASVSSRYALQLLTLVNPRTCHRLRKLGIQLADGPCAELMAEVTSILQFFGAALEDFQWVHKQVEAFEAAIPRLSANTSLEHLRIVFTLPPSPQTIQMMFAALLSDITSSHLRQINFLIYLERPGYHRDANVVPVSPAYTTTSIPTFHAMLSRGIYDRLPKNGVSIHFCRSGIFIPMLEDGTVMSGIKSHMSALFAPWLSRGVLDIKFEHDFNWP
ncbi:uncharacterized protein B0H18DRAFT_1043641 [Fomitopsis serialis]|uniref:uncharacterized protein n=1 Tax=Fomitopsis serialis TaxID=139415 RepID=UPI002008070E|nr:uncharacterized protein B0H18DRAFT_1043641 [Neoantrodia serialis]KAH9914922.1 hypothetical protein B0H18DRAFT_1043641 [Neoantrodia serialis]